MKNISIRNGLASATVLLLLGSSGTLFAQDYSTSTGTSTQTSTTTATGAQSTGVGTELTFGAHLTGSQETPPVIATSSGNYSMTFNAPKTQATFTLSVWSGEDITMAHLHCGPMGTPGPIVTTLMGATTSRDVYGILAQGVLTDTHVLQTTQGTPSSSCAFGIRDLNDLFAQAHAGNIYVNVHNLQYPAGVVRGQLAYATGTTTPTTTPPFVGTTTPTTTPPSMSTTTATGTRTITIDQQRAFDQFIRALEMLADALENLVNRLRQ